MAQQIIHERNHCPCGPDVLPGWGFSTPPVFVVGRACLIAGLGAGAYAVVCGRVAVTWPRVAACGRVVWPSRGHAVSLGRGA